MIPKLNQRVRGKGTARIGVVVDVSNAPDYLSVRWAGDNFNCHPAPHALEWIDWDAPLELDDGTPVEFMQFNGIYHARVRLPRRHSCQPARSYVIDANAFDGLVTSNHRFRVRNRIMSNTVDPFGSLEVVTQSLKARPVNCVTRTADGCILVEPKHRDDFGFHWAIFTNNGQFVRSSDGSGKSLILRNAPKVESVEIEVALPSGLAKIRITTTDGSPTKVEFV